MTLARKSSSRGLRGVSGRGRKAGLAGGGAACGPAGVGIAGGSDASCGASRRKSPVSHQRMDMRMEVEVFAERVEREDDAGGAFGGV
jgi:hypothetical protein